jgi:hypothetical protein
MEPLGSPTKSDAEIKTNAIAVYQVADDLYMHDRFRIDAGAKRTTTAARTNSPPAAE